MELELSMNLSRTARVHYIYFTCACSSYVCHFHTIIDNIQTFSVVQSVQSVIVKKIVVVEIDLLIALINERIHCALGKYG